MRDLQDAMEVARKAGRVQCDRVVIRELRNEADGAPFLQCAAVGPERDLRWCEFPPYVTEALGVDRTVDLLCMELA